MCTDTGHSNRGPPMGPGGPGTGGSSSVTGFIGAAGSDGRLLLPEGVGGRRALGLGGHGGLAQRGHVLLRGRQRAVHPVAGTGLVAGAARHQHQVADGQQQRRGPAGGTAVSGRPRGDACGVASTPPSCVPHVSLSHPPRVTWRPAAWGPAAGTWISPRHPPCRHGGDGVSTAGTPGGPCLHAPLTPLTWG